MPVTIYNVMTGKRLTARSLSCCFFYAAVDLEVNTEPYERQIFNAFIFGRAVFPNLSEFRLCLGMFYLIKRLKLLTIRL